MRISVRQVPAALLVAVSAMGCGGDSSPTGPSGGTPPGVTVNIVASAGSQAFTPNPAAMTGDRSVSWRNSDGVVHRIIANDGSFDTGDIAPGATSRSVQPAAAGANYHCSIHPSMIGAIGSAEGAPPPPCTGEYCD